VLPQVDSTLDEARRRAGAFAGPEWILALHQTDARGRRGRAWAMPRGNFAATLRMQLDEPLQQAALRSFVAALALHDALEKACDGRADLAMKWPNDVLLNGGKVAGILLESIGGKAGSVELAIGIGVNLVAAPDHAEVEARALRPVALLPECGVEIAPEAFLSSLAVAYAVQEERFVTYGFEPIRRQWLDRAANKGARMTARVGEAEYRGTFADVDNDGQLVLETRDGRRSIPAADVFF
jgi:BirA family biotin operon repressor/biotin-[acetyl-CoA-carboxylase] ligase